MKRAGLHYEGLGWWVGSLGFMVGLGSRVTLNTEPRGLELGIMG